MRGISQSDEVNGHDLVPMSEKDCIDERTLLIAAQLQLPFPDLTGYVLNRVRGTSFFFRLTIYSFSPSTLANFSPWRIATVFLLQMMRTWSDRSRSNSFAQLMARCEMESCSKLKLYSAFVEYSSSTLRPWVCIEEEVRIYRVERWH